MPICSARGCRRKCAPRWRSATPPPPPPARACEAATWDFYRRHVIRSQRADGIAAYRARAPRDAGDTLYRRMWGKAEFVSTGTLRDYDGEPLLAKLDGPKTLFVCGEYDEARPETVAGFAARSSRRDLSGSDGIGALDPVRPARGLSGAAARLDGTPRRRLNADLRSRSLDGAPMCRERWGI